MFPDALFLVPMDCKEAIKNKKALGMIEEDGESLSIQETPQGHKYTLVESENLDHLSGTSENASMSNKIRTYLKERYRGIVLPLGKTKTAYFKKEAENEYVYPAKKPERTIFESKLIAGTELHNLLKASSFNYWKVDDGRHSDATRGWNTYDTIFVIRKNGKHSVYSGEIKIKRIDRGDCFYDITKIKEITDGTIGQEIISHAESISDFITNNVTSLETKSNAIYANKKESLSIVEEDDLTNWLDQNSENLDDIPLTDLILEDNRVRMAKSKHDYINSRTQDWSERWLTRGTALNTKSIESDIRNLVIGVMDNAETDKKYRKGVVDKAVVSAKSMYWLMKDENVTVSRCTILSPYGLSIELRIELGSGFQFFSLP